MAGDLQIPGFQGCCPGVRPLAETAITLPQHRLQGRPVELQKVLQPASQMRIAAGAAQRNALQKPQCACSRQPVVGADPAVDAEQGDGQSPSVQADGDQMGERARRPGTPEQMQVAVFARAAMAVVVALCAAARVHQIARRVVLVLERGASGGEGPHQGSVAFDQAQPVIQRFPRRSIPGAGIHHQREAPHPPSCAPQPPLVAADPFPLTGFVFDDGVAFGAVVCGVVEAWPRAAGRLTLPWLCANFGCCAEAASAEGALSAAADSTAPARPWRRRSASGMDRRDMQVPRRRAKVVGSGLAPGPCIDHGA